MSEKLDGVRAVWRNGEFGSRGDNTFACPEWFKKKMPKGCVLDGEIWGGRGQFQKTSGIVRSAGRHNEWEFLTYMVFDCLEEGGASIEHNPFEARMDAVRRICASSTLKDPALKPVPMEKCANRAHLDSSLAEIEKRGGEGLMLRSPGSKYEHRRSKSLLKVKTFYDEECIVVGHAGGTGRVAGMCGALLCETPDKRRFKVGSGLSDAQRRDPPPLNSVITYRYQELTQDNIPRFPTLVGERSDMTWAQICSTYVAPGPRKAGAMKRTHTILFDAVEPLAQEASGASGASGSASGSRPALKRGLTAMDAMQRGTAEEDLDDFGFDDMLPPVPPEKKARLTPAEVPALEERPVCPYGRRCYRKNPAHFLEFDHPWLDVENEAKDIDAVALPSLAGTQETGPVLSKGAVPAPEPKSSVDAQPDALHERTWTKDPDMRMVAVRNLLSSMLEDAEMPEARKHLQQMLDFADSVPSVPQGSPASVAPAAPAPAAPAPAVTGSGDRERPQSLASALLSTTTSEALFEVPLLEALGSASPVPAPAAPAAGSASSAGVSERKEDPQSKLASELTTMGFPEEGIREALLHCSTADEAVDWLLARSA